MLKNILNKKYLKYIFITLISIFFLSNISLAETITDTSSKVDIIGSIINLLNLIWIPFAIIAGKLFTNDIIFQLDTILWDIWNVIKTFANFIIGFILIASIFGIFIGKTKNILSILGKITIASILVNMSWFIIGAILDLSSILLVSVGAFPLSIIGDISSQATKKVSYCQELSINKEGLENYGRIFTCKKENNGEKIEDFMKDTNKLSGPLIYIGSSILSFNKINNISEINKDGDAVKVMSIQFLIKAGMILLFVVPIILLVIIGIIRLFWIWIYIMFSPLIFLDQVFGGKSLSQHKALQIKNMIGLIFQPVIVVFAMGIVIIFLSTLQTVLISDSKVSDPARKALGICGDKNNSLCIKNNTGTILTIEGNLMNEKVKDSGGFLGYTILMIMTGILLWSLLKLAFTSNEITGSIAQGVYKFAEDGIKAVPILPIGKQGTSIGAMEMALHKGILKSGFDTKSSEQAGKLLDKVYEITGTKVVDLKVTDVTTWENKIRNTRTIPELLKEYGNFMNYIKNNNPNLIPANAKNFQQVVADFINAMSNKYKSKTETENFYRQLGLLDEKKNPITNASKMFEKDIFRQFVSGSIKNTEILNGSIINIGAILNTMHSEGLAASDLNRSINDIIGKK